MSEGRGEIAGRVRRIPVQYVTGLMGTKEHSVSLSTCATCSPSSALSVCLLLALCTVRGHLIAIYTPHHLSRKEGFSIWMQEYRMGLGFRKCSQLLEETGAKDYKSHPELKCSFYFLQVRMSLASLAVYTSFFLRPRLTLNFTPDLFPGELCLYTHLVQVSNGDL